MMRRAKASRTTWATVLVALAIALTAASAAAQQRERGQSRAARPQLERQLSERFAGVVQRRLGLTDQQMRQLQLTNQRFEPQRRQLLDEERGVRRSMRQELAAGAGANQPRVAELMKQALQLQRRRLDLLESEQTALAEFLTPVQRARYYAIHEQLRHQVQEMRRRRPSSDRAGRMRPGAARRDSTR